MKIEFTDRYQAMGIPYPEPETCCAGQCEGTGLVPVFNPDDDDPNRLHSVEPEDECLAELWRQAHAEHCGSGLRGKIRALWRHREWWYWRSKLREWCDGWHFVKCPDCGGTGKRP